MLKLTLAVLLAAMALAAPAEAQVPQRPSDAHRADAMISCIKTSLDIHRMCLQSCQGWGECANHCTSHITDRNESCWRRYHGVNPKGSMCLGFMCEGGLECWGVHSVQSSYPGFQVQNVCTQSCRGSEDCVGYPEGWDCVGAFAGDGEIPVCGPSGIFPNP